MAEGRTGWVCVSRGNASPSLLPHQPVGAVSWAGLSAAASLPSQVHHILQEVVIGGMVLETNMNEIVAQVEAQSKLEKAEVGGDAAALPVGGRWAPRGRSLRGLELAVWGIPSVPGRCLLGSSRRGLRASPQAGLRAVVSAGSSPSVEMAVPIKVNNPEAASSLLPLCALSVGGCSCAPAAGERAP